MTSTALKFDDVPASTVEPGKDGAGPLPSDEPVCESLFENFSDEIDSWARRALAANGFGDGL